jgi:bifunctional DNA-binding transcriptional regulator/antitoxin component of YhaV-PrlF toxin-antitoxin module
MTIAERALAQVRDRFGTEIGFDVIIVDRGGKIIAEVGP